MKMVRECVHIFLVGDADESPMILKGKLLLLHKPESMVSLILADESKKSIMQRQPNSEDVVTIEEETGNEGDATSSFTLVSDINGVQECDIDLSKFVLGETLFNVTRSMVSSHDEPFVHVSTLMSGNRG